MKLINPTITRMTILITVLVMLSGQAQAMQSPQAVVEQAVDSMVSKLQTNRKIYQTNSQALYDMLDETLLPVLHVSRMSSLILGKEIARSATSKQKDAFAKEFKTFLLQSYATGLLNATGKERVVYEPVVMAPGADKVKIKAKLISASGEAYPIVLSMSNRKDTRWRAYNIDVAGIDFIRTYRSSFSLTLKEKGIDGLILDLRGKNAR